MKFGVPWSVKGIRPEARETAREAARRSGMSLGAWLNSVILQQAEEDGLHAGHDHDDDEAYADELAGVHQRLDDITRRIEQFSRTGPAAYAPKRNRNEQPDQIAELIARLDRRLEQFVNAARPMAMPTAANIVPPMVPMAPPTAPTMPNVQLPPSLDRAIAEITARQRALNNQPSVQQPQPRQPQMAQQQPQQQPAPMFAPVPTQDLSGLEDQLRRITDQIETLRRPGVEEAINALRSELGEIGRALNEAMPRRAIDTIERQIQGLTQRIAEGRQNGVDSGALSGIEHGLAEVRDALRGLTPAENLVGFNEAVNALAHKIDLIVAQKDPATLQQLEHAITTLRDMAAHVASGEAVSSLAAQVQMLGEKVEHISGPASDALSGLEHRIDALSRALAERAQNGAAVPPRLEALVQSLSDKIELIQQTRGDNVATSHLEDRIVALVERLDASDSRLGHLEAIERGLADLLINIQDMRASKDAELLRAQNTPGVDALKSDIARTQNVLDAVNGTLGHVVDRLAMIEKDIRGEGRARPSPETETLELTQPVGKIAVRAVTDAPPVAPRMPTAAPLQMPAPTPVPTPVRAPAPPAAAAPPPPQPQAAAPAPRRMPPVNYAPIDPDLPPDQPLEPGSGPPRQRAGARIAASEAALGGARPAAPVGGKSSFIAAARRAAQTAVQEASAHMPRAAEADVMDEGEQPSLRGKMLKRVKSLFIAASIVAIVVGSVQILGNLFSGPDTTQIKSAQVSEPDMDESDSEPSAAKPEAMGAPAAGPLATPTMPAMPAAPLAGSNLAATMPSLDLSQATQSMPSLLSPPVLNPPAPAGKSDITGSIPKSTGQPAHPPANPALSFAGRLPIAIGGTKLRSAAIAGDAAAAYEIAVRYAEGRGVPVNIEEAARWYERAAAKGLALAQFRYASLLEKGQGVRKDLAGARRLYLAAAAKGNAKAMHNLAVLYAEGIDGRPDYATAAQWFQKASQHGIADSQYNLGVLAARGLGTEKSLAASYKWFALAANQGDKEAARKRDEVASQLDGQAFAAAQQAVKSFVAVPQPQDAATVPVPPGGWDDAGGAPSAHGKSRPTGPMSLGAYNIGKR